LYHTKKHKNACFVNKKYLILCDNYLLTLKFKTMKKILSLVVLVAAVAMVSCAGNNNKKSDACCDKAACEQCEKAPECAGCPAEADAPAAECANCPDCAKEAPAPAAAE
jgi:hypothetical protein